ncbi:metalloregulator ArsR/SmtB family transcription factor [Enterococcus faecalis]|uniref:Winged helix-turn-helix transcriptional regulator n=2 Tax=Enterococcus faecalis TaxID=1351 RepID=A0A7H0FLL9_ENTFL|nr:MULTISPECIES: metalloregulator ArsR/SmtB family transcription factor [Enterococcus]APE73049.2 winged helix-turn-helix transcriptional regulator [Enterococcus faecalis]EEI10617.1 HTH-type transcriptional repressor CzrA [Enterococcus faecalis TX0104]EHK9431755.1 winged helix-turn-helix transcriptional regulator [Enterococcus faecalis]EHK9438360.1 winged helix-turn-helix transcriptional regulator [Enterococcus faecalis]EHL0041580.1 winged helix-turn-helix transcriptional regulator [Enterococcu
MQSEATIMKQMEEIKQVSQLYKVLSDPTRLRILLLLKEGEHNVTAISEQLEMEQSAVSHQLKLLRDSRVVKARREGKTIFYTLDDHHVIDILNQTFEHIEHR